MRCLLQLLQRHTADDTQLLLNPSFTVMEIKTTDPFQDLVDFPSRFHCSHENGVTLLRSLLPLNSSFHFPRSKWTGFNRTQSEAPQLEINLDLNSVFVHLWFTAVHCPAVLAQSGEPTVGTYLFLDVNPKHKLASRHYPNKSPTPPASSPLCVQVEIHTFL